MILLNVNSISENEFCIGCGVCAAVCPEGCIKISKTDEGTLRARVKSDVCINCGKCKTVCPNTERKSSYISPNGECFKGVAPDFAGNAASGGTATYFMNGLLKSKTVDFVVAVKPCVSKKGFFTYTVCKTKEDLTACQGSAYYPVTLEDVLKEVKETDGSCAVIGVPCFITALRKLKSSSGFWESKIKVLIGIVCGSVPSEFMTDSLIFASGHKRDDVTSLRFRIKGENRPAWDYGVKIDFSDGTSFKSFGTQDFGFVFWRKLFAQRECNYCFDVFADDADITFMDAWLPEYKEKTEGTSLIILRNSGLKDILMPLINDGTLNKTDISDAEKSQSALVEFKKNAGNHKDTENLRSKTLKVFKENYGKRDIIEKYRYLCYLENLKKKNKFLWIVMRIKDVVFKK